MWPPWVGVFVSCRGFPGMSFSCGTQLSTDCEREGPHAPWVGLTFLSKIQTYTQQNAAASNIENFTFEAVRGPFFRLHTDVCRTFIKQGSMLPKIWMVCSIFWCDSIKFWCDSISAIFGSQESLQLGHHQRHSCSWCIISQIAIYCNVTASPHFRSS